MIYTKKQRWIAGLKGFMHLPGGISMAISAYNNPALLSKDRGIELHKKYKTFGDAWKHGFK